jgi:4-amino-4-deoxy-L-arabinose transferase-like glycosyltransferase
MLVILPALCFALFVVTYAARSNEPGPLTRWRMSFLSAALTWGLAVTASTEVLSLFHLITFEWLVTFWVGLVLLSAVICRTASTRGKLVSLFQFPGIPRFDLWCLGGVASIVVVAGLVAYVAPPNNPDSIFYHMARVLHWIQNQTVAHYPTNILHQLIMPPWAEFSIMHLHILSGSDQWSNLVQWFSMLGSIIGVSLLAKQLGADRQGQILAVVIAATIPMGILQASSTQNDYVTAFWLVCLLHYILRFKREPAWTNAVGVGASLALALLTKATAYLYAVPLLLWFGVSALANLGWKSWKAWRALALTAVVVLSVNLGHYARNFDLWGNPLGIHQEDPHPNKRFGFAVVLSNVIRNMSVHMGTRSLQLNEAIGGGIQSFHAFLGIDVNDPRTTFNGDFYQNWFSRKEDRAGNPIHFMLMIASLALLLSSYDRKNAQHLLLYALVLIAAFLMFCTFLKWSVWHGRPHLSLFVLWSPFIAAVLLRRPNYKVASLVAIILTVGSILYMSRYATVLIIALLILSLGFKWQTWSRPNNVITFLVAGFLMAAATLYVFRNQTRPLIADNRTILNTNRIDQLFIYHSYRSLRDVYTDVSRFVNSRNCTEVGLITGSYGREYLFWILLQGIGAKKMRIEHVNVTNVSGIKSTGQAFVDFSPCAVIVVDTDYHTAPKPDGLYTKAWSSGPLQFERGSENVSVFVKREAL